MDLELRRSTASDLPFLREMLYEAVFWQENPDKPAFEEGLALPGVNTALIDWGKRDGDTAVIAVVDERYAGAAWFRFYTGEKCIRGYINETIPTIAIAVHSDFRRQGIGEKMMAWLIQHASEHNIADVSLMVSKDNDAVKLYRKCGFVEYEDAGDSLLMLRKTKQAT